MSKSKGKYICRECAYESVGWLGRCPGCGAWNSLAPVVTPAGEGRPEGIFSSPVPIESVPASSAARLRGGYPEFDRVLGGGLVPGSLILLGGDPGVGKSTLLLQYAADFARRHGKVLYVSGEESPAQLRLRAERLGALATELYVSGETEVGAIRSQIAAAGVELVVVDSVQTVRSEGIGGPPGSIVQVRAVAEEFLRTAKETGIAIFLVGHITKTGVLAGPKVLEHMVDTVLYLEGERRHHHRLLKVTKNRFGSTEEAAVLAMEEHGLVEVANPSAAFLAGRPTGEPGTVIYAAMEGNQPLLLELQALVASSGYGTPRRLVSGLDANRVALVLAVLERRGGFSLVNRDVYLSLAGGLRIGEPAADLAVAMAVVASLQDRVVPEGTVIFGEIGLAGEIRPVRGAHRRALEAARLGFRRAVGPHGDYRVLPEGFTLLPVRNLDEALKAVFSLESSPTGGG